MRWAEVALLKKDTRRILRETGYSPHATNRPANAMQGFVVETSKVAHNSPDGVIVYFLGYETRIVEELLQTALVTIRAQGYSAEYRTGGVCHADFLHVRHRSSLREYDGS